MTPHWERRRAPPHMADELLMDAELAPNRSLSPGAFRRMLIVVIVFNGAVAAAFLAKGAFPVAGFLGLDVLALWLAFRMNYRAARARDFVRVAADQIHVARVAANGASAHWVAHPAWARATAEADAVAIRTGGRAVRVGAFLSPPERAEFAKALEAALWRARQRPSTSRIE